MRNPIPRRGRTRWYNMRLRPAHLLLTAATALACALPGTAAALDPLPIPSVPTESKAFEGKAVAARPITHPRIAQNPHLAPNGRSSMHNDAYASDAYTGLGPLGRNLKVTSATEGISECATIAFDSRKRIVGLCGDLRGSVLKILDPVTMKVLASLDMPARKFDPTSDTTPLNNLCGGAYFYLDNRDRAFVVTTDNTIWRVKVGADSLKRTAVFPAAVPEGDCMIAVLPGWEGLTWFVTQQGRVGTIDPKTKRVRMRAFKGEEIWNSFATDETGSAYIVSTHALYRLRAGAKGYPRTVWRKAYNRGTQHKPGQLSQGSGTTPTLIGRRLIAITDNAEPRMRVIFRDRLTGRRLCSAPVFKAGASATENSLVAAGNSVIVENNYGYEGPQSTLFNQTTAPGLARVVYKPGSSTCRVAWTTQLSAPTSVPKASLKAGLLYAYTKDAVGFGLSAFDIRSGRRVWQQRTGQSQQWNNHYAAIYIGPDRSLYMPTLMGLIRFRDS